MNTITLLMAGLLCVVIVNGRHYEDADNDDVEDEQYEARKYRERSGEQSYRRRKWQMSYGYNQQHSTQYLDRRNSYDGNDDVVSRIFKLLDDLSGYIKLNQKQSVPTPPQLIYVPYPIPYPVPQYINCNPKIEDTKTNVTHPPGPAFSDMEDVNLNREFVANDNQSKKDDSNNDARPKSFNLVKSNIILLRQPAEDDHGSNQKKMIIRKRRAAIVSALSTSNSANLEPCNVAILACCATSDELKLRDCYIRIGCNTEILSRDCSQETVLRALKYFKQIYAPIV